MTNDRPKFTPGPWKAAGKMVRDCRVDDNRHAWDFPQQGIAMCYEGRTRRKAEALANAALIAQAPEMYYMLCNILNDLETGEYISIADNTAFDIRGLLAKARGEDKKNG